MPEDFPAEQRRSAIRRVVRATLNVGASVDSVTDAAARVLGLNRTDMRLVVLLWVHRDLAAGRLAAVAGLSSAATTTAIRRLVEAGYVAQGSDPHDARRSVISLTTSAHEALARVYQPMVQDGKAYLTDLDAEQLTVLERFLRFLEQLELDRARELLAEIGLS